MMHQQEIKFFWPLTEQIPLDLDYTDCNKPQLSIPIDHNIPPGGYTLATNATWNSTITAANVTLDFDTTTIKVDKEPPLYRKALYKMLNLKWEKK